MRNMICLAVWLLGMSTTFAQNWTPIYGPSYSLELESSNSTYGSQVVTYNGEELWAIYGEWDAIKNVLGEFTNINSNIVFWNGSNWILPDYPYGGTIYDIANDQSGELYIATDNGVLKEIAGSWISQWGISGRVGTIEYDTERATMLFSEEHISEGNSWSKLYSRNTSGEIILIADVQCRVGDYASIGNTGVFGMVPGEGAFAGLIHMYGIDLDAMEIDYDFPLAPQSSGAFAALESSPTKLIALSSGNIQQISEFNGTSWTTLLTIPLGDGGLVPCYDKIAGIMYLLGYYEGKNIYVLPDTGEMTPITDQNGGDGINPRSVTTYKGAFYATAGSCFDHNIDGEMVFSTAFKLGELTNATDELARTDIGIFPNPAHDNIYIEGALIGDPLTISNIVGQTFDLPQSIEGNRIVIEIQTLPAGVYFMNSRSFVKN